jgi:mannuronan 5-epimerase
MITLIRIFIVVFLSISFLITLGQIDFAQVIAQQQTTTATTFIPHNSCIKYNSIQRLIIVSCKSTTLTDISNQINNYGILDKEPHGEWLLNANLTINPGSTLTIDPTDTTWLKIIADEKTLSYGIHVKGSLKIDSVKITSWNPQTNNYAMSYGSRETGSPLTRACGHSCSIEIKDTLTHHGAPRPYIMIDPHATGTTNITNSYLGYLGYEAGWGKKAEGLHYNAGDGSIVRNNNIDHLYFGFYSVGVGNMLIENNVIHDSGHYGIDPHTGTHDMIIRNNTVYNNNGTAIICSLNCYNILFDGNTVHDNNGAGISFSRNTSNSIARNNIINNQNIPIELTTSHSDQVYNNKISNTHTAAITLKAGSNGNTIYNNTIDNARVGISSDSISQNNKIYSNNISNTPLKETVKPDKNTPSTNDAIQDDDTFPNDTFADNTTPPSTSDNTTPPSTSDNTTPPSTSDNTTPPSTSDNTTPPSTSDNTTPPSTSDVKAKDVKSSDVKAKDVKSKKHKSKKHKSTTIFGE